MNVADRVALITGVCGQDGAYLCRDLLAQGWQVHGSVRPDADDATAWRLRELGVYAHERLQLWPWDITAAVACDEWIAACRPQQVFHLAAISSVAAAQADPLRSIAGNGMGTLQLLDALRRQAPDARCVVACSAESFAGPHIDEASPWQAPQAYALSKLLAYAAVGVYRDGYGLPVQAAILFNHESPLRGEVFVTRKIARAAARRGAGVSEVLALGNLAARRDFGYAPDYVAAMQRMAQHPHVQDFVLATGVSHSVREFAGMAYAAAGVDLRWQGTGVDEIAVDSRSGEVCIVVDAALLRRVDAVQQRGDATRARTLLAFQPSRDVAAIAAEMVAAEQQRWQDAHA